MNQPLHDGNVELASGATCTLHANDGRTRCRPCDTAA